MRLSLFTIVAVIGALIWATAYGGGRGAAGMLLGLGGTSFSLGAGWLAIRMAGGVVTSEPMVVDRVTEDGEEILKVAAEKAKLANILMGLVVLLKLPVVVGAGMFAWRIGGPASTTFLTGLGLVYSSLFGWALLQR